MAYADEANQYDPFEEVLRLRQPNRPGTVVVPTLDSGGPGAAIAPS